LATLGDVTQLFLVAPPQVAKASTSVSLSSVIVAGIIPITFANVNTASKMKREKKFYNIDARISLTRL
jgi:hypothetical protein